MRKAVVPTAITLTGIGWPKKILGNSLASKEKAVPKDGLSKIDNPAARKDRLAKA
jgi:hypothetical protein